METGTLRKLSLSSAQEASCPQKGRATLNHRTEPKACGAGQARGNPPSLLSLSQKDPAKSFEGYIFFFF